MFKSMLLAIFLFTASLSAFANDPAFEIKNVEIHEIDPLTSVVELPGVTATPIDEISIIIDGLMAIGKKIWPIIEAGKPVVNNRLIPAVSILPHLDGEAPVLNQMANWSIPKVRSYRVSYTNGYGSEVVAFTYTIMFQHNGDLNGVGKYVTSLRVQASQIYVAWGFNFDATSELTAISNVGSVKDPVASGIIQIAYTVKTIINESRSAQSFYVDGLGNIQLLNN